MNDASGNRVVLFFGGSYSQLSSLYDYDADSWEMLTKRINSATSSVLVIPMEHFITSAVKQEGVVLAIGANDGHGRISQFDPLTKKWCLREETSLQASKSEAVHLPASAHLCT